MTVKINLLPWREARNEEAKKEFFILLGAGCAASLLLLFVTHMIVSGNMRWQESQNIILKNEIALLDGQLTEIQGLQHERDLLIARMNIIQELQGNRSHTVQLFDNLVKIVPKGLYLISSKRLDNQLTLEGYAESNTRVSKLMRNIEVSTILDNPQLTVIQAEDKETKDADKNKKKEMQGFIKFYLSASIKVDVMSATGTKGAAVGAAVTPHTAGAPSTPKGPTNEPKH